MNSSNKSMNSSSNSGGIFGAIGNAFKKATNAVTGNNKKTINSSNAKKVNNSTKKNNSVRNSSMNAKPVTSGINAPVLNFTAANNTAVIKGGFVAPVNFRYPPNMQQPSEEVMEWAMTAGAPTPTGPQMRNVAHGGKRRTHRKRRSHRRKSTHRRRSYGGKRHRRSKTRRGRHGKRRN